MSIRERLEAKAARYRKGNRVLDIDEPAKCDNCSNHTWLIGRTMAECANCGNAMPLSRTAVH